MRFLDLLYLKRTHEVKFDNFIHFLLFRRRSFTTGD